jgi:hypothetical protein
LHFEVLEEVAVNDMVVGTRASKASKRTCYSMTFSREADANKILLYKNETIIFEKHRDITLAEEGQQVNHTAPHKRQHLSGAMPRLPSRR